MANNPNGRQEHDALQHSDGANTQHEQLSPTNADTAANDDEICELEHLRKLFIGGLAPYTTEENLKNYYGQWGKVVDVVVMRDPNTKRSRGFGFITYTKSKMVDAAQANRPHIIDGKTVEAKRALPRPERESRETNISVKKLFVGGLKDNHDEECLHEYFSQFGEVISIKILTDKTTGKRRGFAFIEYDDYDAVDKAILKKSHSIKYVVVDVKKSIYQEQQLQRLKTDNNKPMQQQANKMGMPMMGNKPQQAPLARPPMPAPLPPPYQQNMPPAGLLGPPPPANWTQNWGPWSAPPPGMPPHQPPPYGYPQQPPHPNYPPHNWNYQPAAAWQAGPPPPPPGSWQPHWSAPPQAVGPPQPVNQAPPVNWNVPPVPPVAPVPQQPPPTVAPAVPAQQPPPTQQPPPAANNFGAGYQCNFAGGPTKQNNLNANRVNPYNAQQQPNKFANNATQPPAAGYGNYNTRAANGNNVSNGVPVNPNNKFRR